MFEKIIFQHLFSYLKNQNIISGKQSGFIPGDSTTNQLSIICHNIYSALDSGDEVHCVFLDFSKAFDKVWHTGLLYKLKRYGVAGNILKLKGLAQAKIIKKSVILFRVLNMTI